jgi:hypothetical protein
MGATPTDPRLYIAGSLFVPACLRDPCLAKQYARDRFTIVPTQDFEVFEFELQCRGELYQSRSLREVNVAVRADASSNQTGAVLVSLDTHEPSRVEDMLVSSGRWPCLFWGTHRQHLRRLEIY